MFMAYAAKETASILANASICTSVSDVTTVARLDRLLVIDRGSSSQLSFLKPAPQHDGWNIDSNGRVQHESNGFDIMSSPPNQIGATRRREGSSRDSKKDYLHFLYIARASLSETQYFIQLARRLRYLSDEDSDILHQQTKFTFACLHGLIGSVEKEAGKLSKVIATVTSFFVIGFVRWSSSHWSVGS